MVDLRQPVQHIFANGGRAHGEDSRQALYAADSKIDRGKANIMAVLHKRLQQPNPGFHQFFYQAIKDRILADGRIGAEEATWLRRMLIADGKIDGQGDVDARTEEV